RPADRPGGGGARRPEPAGAVHWRRRARLLPGRRRLPRRVQVAAAVLRGARAGRTAGVAAVPRSTPFVRDAGRAGVPAVGREGVHGPRGYLDDDGLRSPRSSARRRGATFAARQHGARIVYG